MTIRRLVATAAFGAALMIPPAARALQPHTPVFTDAGQLVTVAAGEDFFIALPSNPTTGYTWTQSIANGYVLAYEGNVYQSLSNGVMGGGGQQIFIYHANRSGATSIAFTYARPFEPNAPPAKSLIFNVTVQ